MTTDSVYVPNEGAMNDLKNWANGDLGTALVHLFDSFVSPDPTLVPTDFSECTFTGYVPAAAAPWGMPFINTNGQAEIDGPALTWSFTAGSGSTLVYGWFMTDAAGTNLLAWCPFQSPVELTPGSPNLSRQIQLTAISQL